MVTRSGTTLLVGACGLVACTLNVSEQIDASSAASGNSAAGAGAGAASSCTPQSGAMPLQRLTQGQYLASLTAAFPQVFLPALDLPADGTAGPFASNAASLVDALAISQYDAAAWAVAQAVAPSLAQGLSCDRGTGTDCLAATVMDVGQVLHRRGLTDDELATYLQLAAGYLSRGQTAAGLTQSLAAMLQSPYFLYRPEVGVAADANGSVPLADDELAGRLAFFLTGAPPDATLRAAAAAGELTDGVKRRVHVNALIDSDAFAGQVASWVEGWLALSALPKAVKDSGLFPAYSADVAAAMQAETATLTRAVLAGPAPTVESLLTTSAPPTSPVLLSYYAGASTAGGAPPTRLGLLTRGAFLAAHGHGNAQSPAVLRGRVVRENLLCQTMPNPPPNIPALPAVAQAGQTARQIFAVHESSPTCAACHKLMDPIGLGMEIYDNAGAWRARDNNVLIDASGQLTGTPSSDGPFADTAGLMAKLAGSPDLHACVVRQMLRFALTRLETSADDCTQARLMAEFDGSGHSMKTLMTAVAMSDVMAYKSIGRQESP